MSTPEYKRNENQANFDRKIEAIVALIEESVKKDIEELSGIYEQVSSSP
jgi:hypothetical protein